MRFKLNEYLEDDIKNKNHPSSFETDNKYSILILRLPFIKNGHVDIISYAFLIDEKDSVYIFDRKNKEFEILGDFSQLHNFLDLRVDKILSKLNTLHTQIAELEDNLYENDFDKSFTDKWLKLKKEITLMERLMKNAIVAFERFLRIYKNKVDNFAYADLKEHFQRALEFAKDAAEKLDYLYEFYRAKQDEKMNRIMFILTLISGIFLPLTLVTGFFGMNTGGLPFANDPQGTIKAAIIGVIMEIPIVFIVWKNMKR